jgi:hypothetical protein
MQIVKRAPQTRDCDVLLEFLRRVQQARHTGDYGPVEAMLAPDVILRTAQGESKGAAHVVEHLKELDKTPYRAQIVAPRGGLMTVNISPITIDGGWGPAHEQVYRLYYDKVVEMIDLGRTPEMVYRDRSQPN